ncbi:SDR family NAD(P)-dependent oxidoreductase [Vibrio fortis]|uniref:SDR family NAD(P)-dependent oxidoreductase n=1 Tax=Vibrio fortis TaxID=212667 RepID=UPI0021C2A1FD|nr:SDR family oxidoreductase [Vibrio fortis]
MNNKVVIITGGSDGIGKAAALEFAHLGANVLITGRRACALAEVASLHRNIETIVADSEEQTSAQLIVDAAIEKWGRIDVLVNNAGAGANASLDEISSERIDQMFSINVVATSLLTKACLPYLRKSQGNIINISSTIGHMPAPNLSHYGASKAAVEYLTQSWALELAPDIRVNAVAPGPTYSGALTGMMGLSKEQAKEVEKKEASMIPMGRRGNPEDISRWIVKLAEPESAWVTGQVIGADGGLGLR